MKLYFQSRMLDEHICYKFELNLNPWPEALNTLYQDVLSSKVISTASSVSAWRHIEEFSIDEQQFVDIYLAFCLSCYTLKTSRNKEVSKSELYVAQANLPQRQWMNYTTNRTLHLATIHPSTSTAHKQLKLCTILSICRRYSSITKEIIQILRDFTTELGAMFFYLI